jgi:indolepyruvate ferredoxin oxidoreductase beta subunit
MAMTTSVILAGVGGQGILLASELLARAAMFAGLEVKTNETHGMAQRGGAVTAQVRFGTEVFSPVIPLGAATVLVAFEMLEALRAAEFLAPHGKALVNREKLVPVTVSSGAATYPADIEARLHQVFPTVKILAAAEIAKSLGNPRAANVTLIGALAAQLDLPDACWQQALAATIKPQHLELNQRAFVAGRQAAA